MGSGVEYVDFLFRALKTLINYLSRRNKVKRLVKEMSQYLEPGTYIILGNLAYKSDLQTKRYIQSNFGNTKDATGGVLGKLRFIVKNVLRSKILLESDGTPKSITQFGKGTVLFLSSADNIRIFDLRENLVMTRYKNEDGYLRSISGDKTLRNLLSAPRQTRIKFNAEHICIEPLLCGKVLAVWESDEVGKVIYELFEQYKLFLEQVTIYSYKIVKDYLKDDSLREYIPDHFFKYLCWKLEPIVELPIPLMPGHGDLHSENILYDGRTWHVLDWEHNGEYVFFYDLFRLFSSEKMGGNPKPLLNYASGIYDHALQQYFKNVGIDYRTSLRQAYYAVSLIEHLSYRKNIGLITEVRYHRALYQELCCFES